MLVEEQIQSKPLVRSHQHVLTPTSSHLSATSGRLDRHCCGRLSACNYRLFVAVFLAVAALYSEHALWSASGTAGTEQLSEEATGRDKRQGEARHALPIIDCITTLEGLLGGVAYYQQTNIHGCMNGWWHERCHSLILRLFSPKLLAIICPFCREKQRLFRNGVDSCPHATLL